MKKLYSSTTLYFFLVMTACTSTESNYQITNLAEAKKAVQDYYESGKYDRECSKIINDAIERLNKVMVSDKSAVVFDVDETALSNYEQTKSIGFGYIYKLWYDFIQEGKAPAIKETKRFYNYLVSRKIHVIFLTGRFQEMYESTKRNLVEQGYTKFDTLIIRSNDERKVSAAEFKSRKREELIRKGYDIIACIGDQWSDLSGCNTGYKIKLPNYLYSID